MVRRFSKHVQSRRGTTAVEYALMLTLVVLTCLASLQLLGQNTRQTFFQIANSLMSGTNGVGSGSVVGTNTTK